MIKRELDSKIYCFDRYVRINDCVLVVEVWIYWILQWFSSLCQEVHTRNNSFSLISSWYVARRWQWAKWKIKMCTRSFDSRKKEKVLHYTWLDFILKSMWDMWLACAFLWNVHTTQFLNKGVWISLSTLVLGPNYFQMFYKWSGECEEVWVMVSRGKWRPLLVGPSCVCFVFTLLKLLHYYSRYVYSHCAQYSFT